MTVTLALLAVTVLAVHDRGRRTRLDMFDAALAWPWVLAEIEVRARDADTAAHGLSEIAFDVLLDGPPPTRAAARGALRALGPTAAADALLGAACDLLASARSERLRELVSVVGRTGAEPGALLRGLRRSEVDDIALHDAWSTTARAGRAGRWLLLAPLAPVATGALDGAAAVAAASGAVALWGLASIWLDAATPRCRPPAGRPVEAQVSGAAGRRA